LQRLKFINALGHEVLFDNVPPFIFWKISGLGIPSVDVVFTQSGGQNGYTEHDLLLNERTVSLSCHIHGPDGARQMYERRRELNRVCNPCLGLGTLIYTNDFGEWQTAAFCTGDPYGDKWQKSKGQTLDIYFECPSPFWLSAAPYQAGLVYISGGIEFPLITPSEGGNLGYLVNIDNDGDADTPLEIYIDGGSVNPIIKNETTGEFLQISQQMQTTDKLYINTDPDHLAVSLITTDAATGTETTTKAYGYLTDDSALFKLVPGMNVLTFHSDDDNKEIQIRIIYYKRYVGV
jgi:hypothetical protein